jgi:hypothetical protein
MKLLNELEADKQRKLMCVNVLTVFFLFLVGFLYLVSEKTSFNLETYIMKLLE